MRAATWVGLRDQDVWVARPEHPHLAPAPPRLPQRTTTRRPPEPDPALLAHLVPRPPQPIEPGIPVSLELRRSKGLIGAGGIVLFGAVVLLAVALIFVLSDELARIFSIRYGAVGGTLLLTSSIMVGRGVFRYRSARRSSCYALRRWLPTTPTNPKIGLQFARISK